MELTMSLKNLAAKVLSAAVGDSFGSRKVTKVTTKDGVRIVTLDDGHEIETPVVDKKHDFGQKEEKAWWEW